MGSPIDDSDMIAHIINSLGEGYDPLVTVIEGVLDVLTMHKLKERLRS